MPIAPLTLRCPSTKGAVAGFDRGAPAAGEGERGYTLLERMSARPTFDINGLWGGYSGEGSKTIIPAWAAAKFSTRLVPDQDFQEIERLVQSRTSSRLRRRRCRIDVKVIHGGAPALTPLDHPGIDWPLVPSRLASASRRSSNARADRCPSSRRSRPSSA